MRPPRWLSLKRPRLVVAYPLPLSFVTSIARGVEETNDPETRNLVLAFADGQVLIVISRDRLTPAETKKKEQ